MVDDRRKQTAGDLLVPLENLKRLMFPIETHLEMVEEA
jgi:hypothetical protein